MDIQIIVDMVGGAILAVLGWFARELWSAVKTLQTNLHKLEVDLPSRYVSKDEYGSSIKEIKDICSKIFDKLDALEHRKADK